MIAGTPVSTRTPITISTAIAINSAKTGAEQHGKRENGQLRPRRVASHPGGAATLAGSSRPVRAPDGGPIAR
jgi:hypothetical protein